MDPLAETLRRSPELFPHALDVANDVVALIRLTEADFEKASFLDTRILTPSTMMRPVPAPALAEMVEQTNLSERCHFIFHLGHVGSTLMARLLGAHDDVLSLREPMILRTLAQMRTEPEAMPRRWSAQDFEIRFAAILKLWSRSFAPSQISIVKATSYTSELAEEILGRAYAPRALMMYVTPEVYIATILAGPNAREEMRVLASSKVARLNKRFGDARWDVAGLSEGEAVAASWAAEMAALTAAADAHEDQVRWLNFEHFLDTPHKQLGTAFAHFGINASLDQMTAILEGPDMRRYAKATEHEYSRELRNAVLDEARARDGGEIKRGLAWLKAQGAEVPFIQRALEIAKR